MAGRTYGWRFFRAGGSDQVAIERGADLAHLDQLDPKLWVALACPVQGLEMDERTLALLDTDGDGRIRAPEVIAAAAWAAARVRNPDTLLQGGDLAIASINDSTPEGATLLASARRVLSGLGKPDAPTLSVADTLETATVLAATRFNGDGVIPVEAIDDAELQSAATDIATTVGTVPDRAGVAGISQPLVDQFFTEAEAYAAWWSAGEAQGAETFPLGDATAAAYDALVAVKVKIDDYFARTKLAAFDARALAAVNRQEVEYLAIAAQDLSITADEVAGFPLSRVDAGRPLPLREGVNPAWAAAIERFRDAVVSPILGASTQALTNAEWDALQQRFSGFQRWQGAQAGAIVAPLGLPRVRALLAGPSRRDLTALIAQDAATEPEMAAIAEVEKLVRFQRDLVRLLHNFVSFRDFYGRERPAIFQAGTLVLDGRSCDLCVRVNDAGKHAALAGLAKTYLAYCDCSRPNGETMTIAAAFTDGDSDNLMVGRNGVFWDRDGRDWDATITNIVENPISIRQAFWAPYKKLVRLIEEQVAKRAAAGQEAADAKLDAAAATSANADAIAKAPAEPKKIDVGTVAALGVAFGALATAFAAIAGYISGLLQLPFWQLILAVMGLLLVVSTPSMLIAWLKLRQRNLGPILDANGWAINGSVRMNVPFGGSLTSVARIPSNAETSLAVKYPEPPTVLPRLLLLALTVAFTLSLLAHFKLLPSIGR
jgi:hypothetical protein